MSFLDARRDSRDLAEDVARDRGRREEEIKIESKIK
jgi:hypothetical protein